jgi:hypothetical protein
VSAAFDRSERELRKVLSQPILATTARDSYGFGRSVAAHSFSAALATPGTVPARMTSIPGRLAWLFRQPKAVHGNGHFNITEDHVDPGAVMLKHRASSAPGPR